MNNNISPSLAKKVFSSHKIKSYENTLFNTLDCEGYSFMEKAGKFAFHEILERFPNEKNWNILCGLGNNAGDGMTTARLAIENELNVSIFFLFSVDLFTGNAQKAYKKLKKAQYNHRDKLIIFEKNDYLKINQGIIIDAIFGIGLNREIDSSIQEIIQTLNNKNLPIISLDIPSGINPDDGRIMGQAINAEMTITFMFKKLCFFLGEGSNYSGFIKYSDLEVSCCNEFLDNCDLNIIDREYVFNFLQRRSLSSHKGDFGHIGIFGSGKGMHGASLLAGEAALRSGAGKVSIFMHSSHRELIDNPRSELILNFIDNILQVESIISNLDVLVLGPGLGKDKWASDIFDFIIKYPQPKVIDADGLVFVKAKNLKQDNWVLTPHPGEAAELLNTSSKNIQDNRQLSLKKISNKFGGVIILKGHNTMIGYDENPSNICLKGNPGMATAGSGDVLAGIVSAMIGQKLSLFDASSVAVEIHAKAGDLASKDGERGLLAGDIIDEIRGCVN